MGNVMKNEHNNVKDKKEKCVFVGQNPNIYLVLLSTKGSITL